MPLNSVIAVSLDVFRIYQLEAVMPGFHCIVTERTDFYYQVAVVFGFSLLPKGSVCCCLNEFSVWFAMERSPTALQSL